MCKNTLVGETDMVLLSGRVVSLWSVLLAFAFHMARFSTAWMVWTHASSYFGSSVSAITFKQPSLNRCVGSDICAGDVQEQRHLLQDSQWTSGCFSSLSWSLLQNLNGSSMVAHIFPMCFWSVIYEIFKATLVKTALGLSFSGILAACLYCLCVCWQLILHGTVSHSWGQLFSNSSRSIVLGSAMSSIVCLLLLWWQHWHHKHTERNGWIHNIINVSAYWGHQGLTHSLFVLQCTC